jgi:hypothetical protein
MNRAAIVARPKGGAMLFKRGDKGSGITWRDALLLPATAVLTWIVLGTTAEVVARFAYPQQLVDACIVQDGSGNHFRSGCHSRVKAAEGGWVNNDYNDCGYRSDEQCGEAGIRLAIIGTSLGHGYWVPYDQTFAGRIEHDLASACAQPVNILNASLPTTDVNGTPVWHHLADRSQVPLAQHPQALLLVMDSYDLQVYRSPNTEAAPAMDPPPGLLFRLQRPAIFIMRTLTANSSVFLIARHWRYGDRDALVTDHLANIDASGYLRQPFSPLWQMRLKIADETISAIAAHAQAAGVPFLVVLVPRSAQAVLARQENGTNGPDPFALPRALMQIAQQRNASFLDLTGLMAAQPDPAGLFFLVDGHLNEEGHRLLAQAIKQHLTQLVPTLAHCNAIETTSRPGWLSKAEERPAPAADGANR